MDRLAGQDAMSDATPPTGTNTKVNEQKMTSKVLKFSFVYTGPTKHKVAPSVIHTHWMQAVQEAYGTDIVIVNNKNQNVETVSSCQAVCPSSKNVRKWRATHLNLLHCPSYIHKRQS
jgi:hypothetical protein